MCKGGALKVLQGSYLPKSQAGCSGERMLALQDLKLMKANLLSVSSPEQTSCGSPQKSGLRIGTNMEALLELHQLC